MAREGKQQAQHNESRIAREVRNIVRPVRSSVGMASISERNNSKGKAKASAGAGVETAREKARLFVQHIVEQADKRIYEVRAMFTMSKDERAAFCETFEQTRDMYLQELRTDRDAHKPAEGKKPSAEYERMQRALNSRKALFSRLGAIIRAIRDGIITEQKAKGADEHTLYAMCPKGRAGNPNNADKPMTADGADQLLKLLERSPKRDKQGNVPAEVVAKLDQAWRKLTAMLANVSATSIPIDAILRVAAEGKKTGRHLRRVA